MVLCSETSGSLVGGINVSDEAFFSHLFQGIEIILIYYNLNTLMDFYVLL